MEEERESLLKSKGWEPQECSLLYSHEGEQLEKVSEELEISGTMYEHAEHGVVTVLSDEERASHEYVLGSPRSVKEFKKVWDKFEE